MLVKRMQHTHSKRYGREVAYGTCTLRTDDQEPGRGRVYVRQYTFFRHSKRLQAAATETAAVRSRARTIWSSHSELPRRRCLADVIGKLDIYIYKVYTIVYISIERLPLFDSAAQPEADQRGDPLTFAYYELLLL